MMRISFRRVYPFTPNKKFYPQEKCLQIVEIYFKEIFLFINIYLYISFKMSKICSKCEEEKSFDNFYLSNDSWSPMCKACFSLYYKSKYVPSSNQRGFKALPEETKNEIKFLIDLGMPICAIAKKVGIPRPKLADWKRRGTLPIGG
ncbi:hypothetical protein [Candidatus Finniella inopinata]|uniref:Uncharacterized protein n=1 Tax=Candidatus Finniella inopinata TaxID=1696036 RepID=A0A4Q7DKT4_9PROT|nr:hypothetical protein [Candidatus Finniella inopinata]RZI45296.1 hypothetical protein EQU50_07605 [Candidatus Finniella inopinata]